MSRILAIHRYYWPDAPPYASLLRSIVETWTTAGHDVDVLTSQPSYKSEARVASRPSIERVDGAQVRRIAMQPDRSARWRRPFNVAWFPLVVGLRIAFGRRYDVVMCSTAPPVVLGWVVSAMARLRGARFVYHCMDLHPEIGRLSGEFSSPKLYGMLARLELATCRRASTIVVLSEDMRAAVVARNPSLADKTTVITNFELPDFSDGAEASPVPSDPTRVRITFTGNIGRFQGLGTIVAAVLSDEPELDGVQLVLMGEGAYLDALRSLVAAAPAQAQRRVEFVPHGTAAAARALLATSDAGLVSLAPDVIRYAYPSKMATYLGVGLPVLAAVEPTSSLARTVLEAGAGDVLPVSDQAATRAKLLELVRNPHQLRAATTNARDLWSREYDAERLLPRWASLVVDPGAASRGAGAA